MTRAYVLDGTTHDVLGLVDQSWEHLAYTRRYFGMDTFQMSIQRARLYANQLSAGRLLYLPDEGNRIFLIEQVTSLAEGSAANDLMTVSGRSMEGIVMVERIVIPDAGQAYDKQTAQPAETAMKHYVSKHAEPGVAAAARQVPGLNVTASAGAGVSVTVSGRYQTVFDIVNQIGLLSGIGWEILWNPTTEEFDFDVIVGVDRSTSVFFDFEFETLERWEELESILESKTFALIAGQGEGKDRDIVTRPVSEPTGMARREVFLDARDIELGATTELTQRADSFLAAATKVTRLEAGIHQYGSFRYGIHWDMGDLVLVRNVERGISYTARVVEVTKSFEASMAAPVVTAIIDRPFPTMKEQINGAGAAPGAVDYPDTLNPAVDSLILDRLNQDSAFVRTAAGRIKLYGPTGVNQGLDIDGSAADQYASLRFLDAGAARIFLDYGTGSSDDFRILTATGAAGAEVATERLKLEAAGRLLLSNTGDVTLAGTAHAFQIGPDAGSNISMDANEIMARSNGAVSPLALNADGGRVTINANNAPTTSAADGLLFGADVTLYRAGANVLATDDSLLVIGDLFVGASTGAGQSADGVKVDAGGSIELRSANPFIDFKTSDVDFGARIIYDFTGTDYLEFSSAARYTFDALVAVTGDLTSTSFQGSTVDSGSGTITIAGDGTATFSTQTYQWFKYGRLVLLSFIVSVSANGSGTSTVTFTFPSAPIAAQSGRVWMDRGGTGVQPVVARFNNVAGDMQFSAMNRMSVGATYTDQSSITGADLINGASYQGTFAYLASA